MNKSNNNGYEKMLRDFFSGKAEWVTEEKMIEGIKQGVVEEVSVLRIIPTPEGLIIIRDNPNKKRGV